MSDIPASGALQADAAIQKVRKPRLDDPVFLPGQTAAAVTDRICALVLRDRAFLWWYAGMLLSLAWVVGLMIAIGWVFIRGPGIWGLDWPSMWGFAIIDYVWWIGIGCGAAFVSALFALLGAEWRAGISRLAESIAVVAAGCAGIFPIIHLGRPWLFYWLYPYPNIQGVWPNWRSPLLWDFWGIHAFLLVSIPFWLLSLIPDFAALRDRARTRGRQIFYGVLAMGFRGSGAQWRNHRACYRIMAVLMLLAAINTHSIAALDFAGAATLGWHSTMMPPYFIFGAVYSGAAMILFVGLPLRRLMRLGEIITGRHVDVLCRIMVVSSLLITYCYAMEAFMTWYGGDSSERTMFADRAMGQYWYIYWGTILFNCILPIAFWVRRVRMLQPVVIGISFFALVGMWMDPYKLIPGSLFRPRLPSSWGHYHGSWFDWLTLIGSIGFFFFLMHLIVRLLPVVNIGAMRRLLTARVP